MSVPRRSVAGGSFASSIGIWRRTKAPARGEVRQNFRFGDAPTLLDLNQRLEAGLRRRASPSDSSGPQRRRGLSRSWALSTSTQLYHDLPIGGGLARPLQGVSDLSHILHTLKRLSIRFKDWGRCPEISATARQEAACTTVWVQLQPPTIMMLRCMRRNVACGFTTRC